jgi:hypothetical protein
MYLAGVKVGYESNLSCEWALTAIDQDGYILGKAGGENID